MKKRIFVFIVLFAVLFCIKVNAEYNADIYGEIVNKENTEKINQGLQSETKEILDEMLIDPLNPNWSENIDAKGVFSVIFSFIKSKGKEPFYMALKMLSILVLCALMQNFAPNASVKNNVDYIALCAFLLTLCLSLYSLINACVSSLKAVSAVITAVIPLSAAILSASGKPLAASALSGVVMFAAAALSFVATFLITPCMKAYLAMGVCASLSKNNGFVKFAAVFKKVVLWIFSLCVTVFGAVLKIKSTLAVKADSLSLKTAKFVLGSSVPVAGSILSESLGTVLSSLELIKSSICLYAVVAIAFTVLPLVIEIMCYRLCFAALNGACDLLLCPQFNGLCELFNTLLSCLQAFLLLSLALFIISLGVAVSL